MLKESPANLCVLIRLLLLLRPGEFRLLERANHFARGGAQEAEALLKQMTLDEKVGQMNQSSGVQMPMLGSRSRTT